MKVLYFDCAAGISGEMLVGGLLDLGGDIHRLARELSCVNFGTEYEITKETRAKNGISATLFSVRPEDARNETVTGGEIVSKILSSSLKESVKQKSVKAFLRLLSAESTVSGEDGENIVFLKKDAVKAAVLIISAMALIGHFAPDSIVFSCLTEGSGFVNRGGTVYSIPEPVVSELLRQRGVPVIFTSIPKALITPVGAAAAVSVADNFSELPSLVIKAVGYGAAEHDLDDRPAVLRVISGESLSEINAASQIDFSMESSGLFFDPFGYNMDKTK